jgi:hypothetical protein
MSSKLALPRIESKVDEQTTIRYSRSCNKGEEEIESQQRDEQTTSGRLMGIDEGRGVAAGESALPSLRARAWNPALRCRQKFKWECVVGGGQSGAGKERRGGGDWAVGVALRFFCWLEEKHPSAGRSLVLERPNAGEG